MSDEPINLQAVTRFLAARYGNAVESVALLGGGDWSRAFSFHQDNRDFVIRFGRHIEDFRADQKAMAFAGPQLPVPTVREIGEAGDGLFYAISERHFGVFLDALDEHGWRTVLPALLRGFDALRDIPAPGSGVDWAGEATSTPLGWRRWLVASLEDRPGKRVSGWKARLAEDPDANAVFVAADHAMRSLLAACPEKRHVLHRDLLNRNVLVSEDASRLQAVFDWGCSLAGDFLYDVAWLTFWAPWYPALESLNFRRAVEEHYAAIGLSVENFAARLSCYELHIGLDHLAYATFTNRHKDRTAIARRARQVLEGAGI